MQTYLCWLCANFFTMTFLFEDWTWQEKTPRSVELKRATKLTVLFKNIATLEDCLGQEKYWLNRTAWNGLRTQETRSRNGTQMQISEWTDSVSPKRKVKFILENSFRTGYRQCQKEYVMMFLFSSKCLRFPRWTKSFVRLGNIVETCNFSWITLDCYCLENGLQVYRVPRAQNARVNDDDHRLERAEYISGRKRCHEETDIGDASVFDDAQQATKSRKYSKPAWRIFVKVFAFCWDV